MVGHPPLPDTAAAPVVASTPAHYEVDPRGHRVEGRAARAPGARLVRASSALDVAALLGLTVHLAVGVDDVSIVVVFALLSLPVFPLVALYVACASGMEDMTLRVRRIVGSMLPALVLVSAGARGRLDDLLAAALVVKLPLVTMPFGAFAAHRALRLDARAHERARAARRWTAMGAVVLVSGVFLVAVGVLEAKLEVWWYGLLWMAAGVLCVALSRDVGASSSDRRLRRGDRRSQVAWLLPPLGALLGLVRLLWILSRIP